MMAISASDIRAGRAYVELSAEDAKFVEGLKRAEARLSAWVERNRWSIGRDGQMRRGAGAGAGSEGLLTRTFSSTMIAGTIKVGAAIAATRLALGNLRVLTAAFTGDWRKAREEVEKLPFGIGQIARSLAGPVDAAMQTFIFRLKGIQDIGPGRSDQRARRESVEQYNRGATAIGATRKALDKAVMSAREFAEAEVRGMNLTTAAAEKLLALKFRLIKVDEDRKKAEAGRVAYEAGEKLISDARDKFAELTLNERDFIAYQVRNLDLAANQAQSLLSWRQGNYDVLQKQKRVQEEINTLMDEESDKAAEWYRNVQAAVDADQDRYDEAYNLTQAMRTPREKAGDEIAKYREMIESGLIDPETYRRAVKSTIEDLAATMPEVRDTTEARGTFGALGAAYLGTGGVSDRIAAASEQTAKNTDRLIALTRELGVTFG